MTPRTKESGLSRYSEALIAQLDQGKQNYPMSPDGPMFEILHPALIKTQILFEDGSEELVFKSQIQNWKVLGHESIESASKAHPGLTIIKGWPWKIYQFLENPLEEALIDFDSLGVLFISRSKTIQEPAKKGLFHYQLPLWFDYALSPELWGPGGKWTRFHQTLHELFTKKNLLVEQDYPGYYALKTTAQKLEKSGFKGKLLDAHYLITLPWDFPLSGLKEMEKLVLQEL